MDNKQKAKFIELLWNSLKQDKDFSDRKQTGWGTKTEKGLIACIDRINQLKPERTKK